MAGLGNKLVTLADVAKSKDAQVGKVAEVLTKENPMLLDIPYMEMNEGTSHKESIRSNLPQVYYRKANQAIAPSKTTIEERTFSAAHFESKSQMDLAVAKRGGADRVAFNRWLQATGHIQAMGQEHANLTVYGSPDESNLKTPGLMDIYSTVDESKEETAKQVIDGGGTGSDNASILLVHWGELSVFGVYPKGTQAGLKRTDRGEVQIQGLDAAGNAGTFWGLEEQFEIDHGLVVKDFRQAGRICNIDISNLQTKVTPADIMDLMISLDYKIHTSENGKGIWYMNRTLMAFLHKQARTTVGASAGLSYANIDGQQILTFLGKPIRRSDALLNTEARVV